MRRARALFCSYMTYMDMEMDMDMDMAWARLHVHVHALHSPKPSLPRARVWLVLRTSGTLVCVGVGDDDSK